MGFSKYLYEREEKASLLVQELGKTYKYVSILGTEITGYTYQVNKFNSFISETNLKECGFVVKLNNGNSFLEYAFNEIPNDIPKFAKEIETTLSMNNELEKMMINVSDIDEEPLEKSFSRESDIKQYEPNQIISNLSKIKDDTLAVDSNIVNAQVFIRTTNISKMFISKKRKLKQDYSYANGGLIVVYSRDGKTVMARNFTDSVYLKVILDKLPTYIDSTYKKAMALHGAKQITPGYYDVITAPSITGLIAHEAFGHGVEMDQFVKDRALAKEYINEYVASPIVNMKDGAASALSVASYFFDDDGVLASDTQIIKNGILVSGICDYTSSILLGVKPTGNGRRQSFSHKTYTRMTNTFIEKGQDKLEDMIKSIKHGYMLFETSNGMEDPKNWNIQCVCEYGIEIVDGKLTDNYVSPVVMSGYVPDLLKSITMISDDFEISGSGMCGKGYKEWVTVSDGGPALKAKVKLG